MAHELAIVALDGCMASCVTGVLDVLPARSGSTGIGVGRALLAALFAEAARRHLLAMRTPRQAAPHSNARSAFKGGSLPARLRITHAWREKVSIVPAHWRA